MFGAHLAKDDAQQQLATRNDLLLLVIVEFLSR